ncbi:MAG: FG-GAP repeat protein [Planctomycetota bacterium]|nr:FG-GAP repeat protein [Planctomycetota bacterium]
MTPALPLNMPESQKLLPSFPFGQIQFGHAVAIDGDRIVVGARFDSWSGTHHGAIYIFERVGTTWIDVARFQPTGMPGGANFGISVSIDGDRVAGGTGYGNAAYVFTRDPQGLWTQQQKLVYTGNSLQPGWNYGGSVVLNGSTLFVSSEDTVGSAGRAGRSYVYEEVSGVWIGVQTVTSLDLESLDGFYISESKLDLAVGSALDRDNGVDSGAAYVFRKTINGWVQTSKVLPNTGHGQDFFYFTPTLSGNTLMIGAPGDDEACLSGNNCDTGAVYFFDLAPDATQYGSCYTSSPCGNTDNHGGCRNSTTVGAILQASGSGSIAADDLVLEVREMPAGTATLMFMGSAQGSINLGSGKLVTFGGPLGLYRLGVQFADAEGVIVRPPGLVAYSQMLGGLGAISPGQTWNFQCWYRDLASPCGITNNLSNGLSVQFVP